MWLEVCDVPQRRTNSPHNPYRPSKSHTSLSERPMDAQIHIHTWTYNILSLHSFKKHLSQMHRENLDLVVYDYEASYKSSR